MCSHRCNEFMVIVNYWDTIHIHIIIYEFKLIANNVNTIHFHCTYVYIIHIHK